MSFFRYKYMYFLILSLHGGRRNDEEEVYKYI